MTKAQMIKMMTEKANALTKNPTWEGRCEIWDMCNDWNREHEDDEIFMCEHDNEETGMVDEFFIEYDYWVFED